ncbi:MAG TPA: GIY-YIG nuclease family protein [Candidatus Woesebacteria bacterium]|nr:GIY-YIG nuclease family protein [Candidatus Woesebacteria bacterium]
MYYVYFLKSKKKAKWSYVGLTNNINRRLQEHKAGSSSYTKFYLPIDLVSYIAINDFEKAKNLELYFKTGSGIAFMRKRILNYGALAK